MVRPRRRVITGGSRSPAPSRRRRPRLGKGLIYRPERGRLAFPVTVNTGVAAILDDPTYEIGDAGVPVGDSPPTRRRRATHE